MTGKLAEVKALFTPGLLAAMHRVNDSDYPSTLTDEQRMEAFVRDAEQLEAALSEVFVAVAAG